MPGNEDLYKTLAELFKFIGLDKEHFDAPSKSGKTHSYGLPYTRGEADQEFFNSISSWFQRLLGGVDYGVQHPDEVGDAYRDALFPTQTPTSTKGGAPMQYGGTPPIPPPTPMPTPTLSGNPVQRFFEPVVNPGMTYARYVEQGTAADRQRSAQMFKYNKMLDAIKPAMSADRAMLGSAARLSQPPELSDFLKKRRNSR